MLYHSHFSTELRAVPVLVAKITVSVIELSFVADADRRYALLELEVVRGSEKRASSRDTISMRLVFMLSPCNEWNLCDSTSTA